MLQWYSTITVAPPCLDFLLKISLVNPYLKILDLANLLVANAPIKKIQKNSLPPLRSLYLGLKNRPWFEGLSFFLPQPSSQASDVNVEKFH